MTTLEHCNGIPQCAYLGTLQWNTTMYIPWNTAMEYHNVVGLASEREKEIKT